MGGGTSADQAAASFVLPRPASLLPLVRQLSYRLTPWLMRMRLSANQVTVLAILSGLAGAACFTLGSLPSSSVGALLFILCNVLDNCDGEVARLTGRSSRAGARLDDFGDWIVHASLFLALGLGMTRSGGAELWTWLGAISAVGITIGYGFDIAGYLRGDDDPGEEKYNPFHEPERHSWLDKVVFTFRVLLDADFCFILLAFVLVDAVGLLLVSAAIGNHVWWLTAFYENAGRFRA